MNYNLYEALKNGADPYKLDSDFIAELATAKAKITKEKAEAAEKNRVKEEVETKRKALKQALLDFTVTIYREDGQKEMADKLATDPEALEAVGDIANELEKELRKIAKITKPIGDLVELLDSLKTQNMEKLPKKLKPQTDDEVIKTFIGKL